MDKKVIENIWRAFQEVQEKKKLSPAQKKHMDKDKDGDIDASDLAALRKEENEEVEESSCGKMRKEERVECPKCKGKGCDHCDDTGYHVKEEAPADPIKKAPARKGDKSNAQPSELKKEEVEQVDELSKNLLTRYKKKADAQTTDHMKKFDHGGKKPSAASTANFNKRHAGSNTADDKIKGKYAKVPATDANKGLKKEEVEQVEADWLADLAYKLDQLEAVMEKKDKHTKGATEPEGIMDKESPKSKEFADAHKKSDKEMEDKEEKGHDDVAKAGRAVKSQSPARRGDNLKGGDNKPVK